MKRTTEFIGVIPNDLASELRRFCSETGIVTPNHADYTRFRIIAPPKMFSDYKSGATILKEAILDANAAQAERIRLRNQDPILVYQMDDSDYFAVIKSWGEDFTPKRRLYGMLTQPWVVKLINFLLNLTVVSGLTCINIAQFVYWCNFIPGNADTDLYPLVGLVIGVVLVVVKCMWMFNDWISGVRKYIVKAINRYNINQAN